MTARSIAFSALVWGALLGAQPVPLVRSMPIDTSWRVRPPARAMRDVVSYQHPIAYMVDGIMLNAGREPDGSPTDSVAKGAYDDARIDPEDIADMKVYRGLDARMRGACGGALIAITTKAGRWRPRARDWKPVALPSCAQLGGIDDTTAVVRALWKAVAEGWGKHPAPPALVLWMPDHDTASFAPSHEVASALARSGVPASPRRPVGDDTVVVQLTSWRGDAREARVSVRSAWAAVIGREGRRCRASSMNIEEYVVRLTRVDWVAERSGPVTHGDGMCVALPRQ